MQSIADSIQAIARQRGRGDATPLIALRQLDGAAGERVSHLPVDHDLSQAWLAMTGAPFRPHHAHALAALRRGDPVALRASSSDVRDSAHLLSYAALTDEPHAAALYVLPDDAEALSVYTRIEQINDQLPATLRLPVTLVTPGQRPDPYARIIVATAEALHGRLLRHHDRAWRLFWPALRLIVLPEVQRYSGVAGAHLADLLLRALRVIAGHGGAGAAMLCTLTEVAEPAPTLTSLLGQEWRIVNGDDGERGTPLLAVWQGGAMRLRETADLAIALQRQGYQVHIACDALEQMVIAPVVGDTAGVSVGVGLPSAQVLVSAGYPGSTSQLRRMLRADYQAVVVVLGDLPHEQAIARHVEALISGPPTAWPPPPANAYATAQHVLCAASELPLTGLEIELWGAREVVARLAAHNQLVDMPDPEEAWKPAGAAGDPYADFSLLAASGAPITARTEQGVALGAFDPTGFERWTYPGAALPPGAGGMRVTVRDEQQGTITLRMETNGRRTYPLRRCTVEVRETRETRALAGSKQMSWGRVVASEEVYGYREATSGQAATDMALKTPLVTRWVAPACWFDTSMELATHGQLVGWSLAAALPLRVLCAFTDTVPCYDQAARRVYLIDAQPGGSGLALWLYGHAEELLPLAYEVALACRSDALLEPLSRADQDWLLGLLGRSIERQPQRAVRKPAPAEAPPTPIHEPPLAPLQTPPPARLNQPPAAAPAARERPLPVQAQNPRPSNAPLWDAPEPEPPFPSAPAEPPQPERVHKPPVQSPRPIVDPPRPPAQSPGERRPPPAPAPAPDEGLPDASALIDRLRRQRQQREGAVRLDTRQPQQPRNERTPAPIERRFAQGDRIFCLPYGDGVVQQSRIADGRELLRVRFPDHGELEVDPAVSLVRKLEDEAPAEDDLL